MCTLRLKRYRPRVEARAHRAERRAAIDGLSDGGSVSSFYSLGIRRLLQLFHFAIKAEYLRTKRAAFGVHDLGGLSYLN